MSDNITLSREQVSNGVDVLLRLLNGYKDKKSEINIVKHTQPIFLQVNFAKIPVANRKIKRFLLPYSVLTDTSDVCLFVPDLVRGRNVDHEHTVKFYSKLLQKRGVKSISQIIPSRQVRTEFDQYEAKRKLCNSFDVFLIDSKISSFLIPKLGKQFQKTRKWPIPVHLKKKDLEHEISSKLRKTSLAFDGNGLTKTLQIGTDSMISESITENILAAANQFNSFPCGWKNIRSLTIKGPRSASVPIYMSLVPSNNIPIPKEQQKKPLPAVIDELTTIGKQVKVHASGKVTVIEPKEPPILENNAKTAVQVNGLKIPKVRKVTVRKVLKDRFNVIRLRTFVYYKTVKRNEM